MHTYIDIQPSSAERLYIAVRSHQFGMVECIGMCRYVCDCADIIHVK